MNIVNAACLAACFTVTMTFVCLYSSAALPPLRGFFWSVAWWGRRKHEVLLHRERASSSFGPLSVQKLGSTRCDLG